MGHIEDDPDIQSKYENEKTVSNAIKTSGFGANGTSKKDIIKNSIKIGFIRTYPCDNRDRSSCKKKLRIHHKFDERD